MCIESIKSDPSDPCKYHDKYRVLFQVINLT